MTIIGLVGKKYVGKDTFTDIIIRKSASHGKYSIRMGFADLLKREVCVAINSVNALNGGPTHSPITIDFINKYKEKFRSMLQWWGTDYRRDMCNKNYWIDRTLKQINSLDSKLLEYVIFSDVRFANEAKMIKELGGYLVNIQRETGHVNDVHSSETELDFIKCDYQIVNNGTVFHLIGHANSVIETILIQQERNKTATEVIK